MATWIPKTEGERLRWLQNLALKLGNYVGVAGVTAADVTFVGNVRDGYQWILGRSEQIDNAKQEINAWKRLFADGRIGAPLGSFPPDPAFPAAPGFVPSAGSFAQIIRLVERIRNSAGYTTAMGEDLGIVPPGTKRPLGDPRFKAAALPGSQVRLKFVKGASHGVLIESQRGDETGWTVLGSDRFSPYVDKRPPLVAGQPEVRRYRIRYLEGDDPVGNYSAVMSVVTVP